MSFHASLRGDEAGPKLRLDGTALDPRRGLPLAPLHRLLDGPAGAFPDEPSLHLIQLAGPVRDSWIAALRAAGIDVLQYAPEDAYLVFEPPSAIARARGLPFVRWAGPFPPSLRLAPALREIAATARGSVPPGKASLDVIVQLFDTGDLRALENWLAAAGGTAVSTARLGRRIHLRAQVPPELLAPVARWPSVYRVEPFPRLELYGERAAAASTGAFPAEATCVEPGYEAWLARKGVRGEGMIVQVMDDGIERGDASGLPGTAHPDLLGAIAGVANATSDAEADSRAGHGSFNAGLIAGRAATGAADAAGFLLGLGVAPASGVFGTKIFNNLGRFEIIPRTFPDLVAEASRRGAAISSNSWGASVFGEYDALAAEFDFLARDASPDPGEQPMTFVFAAGNEGDDVEGGAQSIGSPATAKNVVSVGASEGCGGEGRDGCGTGADGADSIRDVADFSSRGPQADGRLGPTLVAPGTHIAGVASTAVGYDGSGLCDALWPPGQVLYARGSGTSHSCPLVAGAAALFHQHRLAKTAEAPSPALVRAAIASTAVDLAGGADGLGRTLSSVPGDVQGWGRLAMEDLIPDTNAVPRALFFDQATLLGDTGDAWEVIVFPLDRARPLRIALAWSDAPALPGASPVLVNDLDLEVESGELYLGNRFDGGFSAPGGEPDRLNNLERVALKEPAPVIKVRVRAAHIRGDGAPAGDATDQDFALVVQGGTLQSSRGVVGLRRGKYACDSIVAIDVSDLDLKGKGAVQVTVESTAAAEPVAVALTEVNPGTGVFDGTVLLGKDPGELFVQDGSTITARYADADDGTGSPAASTAVAGVDCVAPEITEVRVEELTDSSAVVRWTTSEEATGKVHAGTECAALQIEASAPRRSRTHAVTLAGLPAGTRHHFTVAATDLVGNTRADDHGGACYSFHTSALVCGFQDDVEPEPVEGWTHRSEQGPDDWAAVTFRGARSPTQAWHAAGFDGFKDSFLITPALEVAEGDRFSFWHTFQLEKGYDGAVLEISANDGATWSDLGPHIVRGGYVEVVSGSPLGDRMAWTGSRTEPMSLVEVDLSAWAGPARRIRFRIATDSSFVEGFGWYVDDIAVCRALNKRARVSVDRSVYRCGDGARVRVDDLDLAGAGSAAVLVSSTSRPEPLTLAAAERPPGSGVLLAEVLLADVEGGIQVAHGDEVLVSYEDADDGTGAGPVQAAARATVDCAAPAISGVRIVELLDDEATIAWETDEPALTEIAVGPDCAAPATRVPLPVGGTSHVAVLGDLTADATYRFVITARDEAGNVAVDDAGGVCRAFRPTALCSERYDFDAGAPGWTHAASLGADAWRLEETPVARTPPAAWFLPGENQFSDASLFSPVFLVPPGSYLAFWHAFDFEEGFDGAVLEVSGDGGATWTDLGPQVRRGGYNGVLVAPNPIAGRRAWTGSSAAAMTRVVVDLERWAGAFAQVRFRATSDASVGGAGWYIDRVEVCRKVREEAALSLDRPAYSCQGSIHLRILDTGRAGLGQAQVELSSGSDPGPKLFDLQEVGPNTGVFEGEVPLVAEDGPGALIVKEGDEVRAVYRDADGGGGDPREAAASAVVDCAPPAISAVALEEVGESSAVVRWETDEDAFGRVEIGLDCAGAATAVEEGAPRRAHRVVVAGLEPGTVHAFRVACRDRAGNSSVDDAGGACHGFRTRVLFCPFEDDLEPAPAAGWDGGGPWRHEESPHARSAPHAWRIQGVGRRGEASLTLPVFRSAPGMVLELFHTFELATGLAGGVIEGSTDGGSTWTDLEGGIVEGAYAGFLLPGNPLEGRRAWTGGRLGAPARVRVRLDALGEGDALVRLRLASQGIAPEGEWIVDDFKVCRRVGESGVVGFGEVAYACGAAGTAFAADAELTGSALVALEVTSSRQVEPLLVQAAEVLPGFFRGSFAIAAEPAEGAVLAADGDALTVTYRDARDESGAAAVVERSAPVDCVRPRLLNLRLGSATFSTLEVLWETSEPAHGRVRYGESCDNLDRLASSGHLVTMHAAVLGGLAPEAAVELRIEATDLAGNATLLPECIRASIARRCELEDSLEPPVDGWTHSAAVGPDDWSLVELDRSHSPTRSWHAPNPGLEKDASLVLPRIEAPEGAVLSFWHTYQLEAGFDGAVLEVSDDEGLSWQDLGPEIFLGGYTDLISTAGGSIPGWTGGAIGDMTLVSASLAKHAGPKTRVRFRILCDDSVGTAGWYLDDVSICTFAPAASASRFARGNCNADEGINLSDAIFLLNHLFLGGAEPTCPRACDSDSNDALNLTDAVYLLDYLFRGGPPMAPPAACDHELEPRDLECAAEACAGG